MYFQNLDAVDQNRQDVRKMLSFTLKRIGFASLTAGVLLLSGCAQFSKEPETEILNDAPSGGQNAADELQDSGEDPQDTGSSFQDAGNGEQDTDTDGSLRDSADIPEDAEPLSEPGGYYYRALSEGGERAVYEQMLSGMKQMTQDEILDCGDEDLLYRIFCCVLADHPELFYVTGYTYAKGMTDDQEEYIRFSATYSMSENEAARCQSRIDEYMAECFQNLPEGDDYDKIRYLYEYLIRHTEYDLEAPENQNICSVFLYGRSVCQGYAKAFQYLCMRAGIEASLVTGRIRESGYGHAWNFVRSDGAYYYVDTTWGDASYTMEGANAPGSPDVNYEYLCVTTEQIAKTHEIDQNIAVMPECTASEDNYFVREQAFFTSFDEAALDAFFVRHEGEPVTFRCETADIYSRFHEYLIAGEHIFHYMDSDAGVSYSDNEETLTFSFWLPAD